MSVTELLVSKNSLHRITVDQAWHYRILPTAEHGNTIEFLSDQSVAQDALQAELEVILGGQIILHPIPAENLARLLSTHYIRQKSPANTPVSKAAQADNFLTDLIGEAKSLKSSDIHIESYEEKCRVRIRIDGSMVERYVLNRQDYPALINKVKILANLDIAEKRLPQDGRMNYKNGNDQFDIRVSILPTLTGEKVVLRLLNNDATDIDLDTLGFSPEDLQNYKQGIARPNGILLISGPTGSGKTTTLYATLKLLNKTVTNILTIEDPVEYTLEGVNQVQLKESIGLTFGAALRTFLRQDPDIIMVGEIRDVDTANMAIRAALTGHLVLSTIHTNSAWGTVSRLIDMGIPPFLVASTLNTSVAQRLIKLLCPHCKEKRPFDPKLYPKHFQPFSNVDEHCISVGCEQCHYTGYKGRKAVYEVIPIDQELAFEIKTGNTHVQTKLADKGIRSLALNAFALFADGTTSIQEIYPLLFNY